MKYTGETRRNRNEAKNDLETKKSELSSKGYWIGNDGIEHNHFFGTYQAFIHYFEKR